MFRIVCVPSSGSVEHTPQGKSRPTSSIIIQVIIFGTISYKFDIPLHITVQNYAAKHRLTHTKNIMSNFSQARSTLPVDGSPTIRNMSE